MKNIFDSADVADFISRINNLTPNSLPIWGKMDVARMLAHCNVTYEMVYEDIHPKPSSFKQFFLKLFIKGMVINDKPYKKNLKTSPEFIIKDSKLFDVEIQRLIDYITKTQQLGENHFNGKSSHSFGKLTTKEWNNLFSKHLDHHLSQFGV